MYISIGNAYDYFKEFFTTEDEYFEFLSSGKVDIYFYSKPRILKKNINGHLEEHLKCNIEELPPKYIKELESRLVDGEVDISYSLKFIDNEEIKVLHDPRLLKFDSEAFGKKWHTEMVKFREYFDLNKRNEIKAHRYIQFNVDVLEVEDSNIFIGDLFLKSDEVQKFVSINQKLLIHIKPSENFNTAKIKIENEEYIDIYNENQKKILNDLYSGTLYDESYSLPLDEAKHIVGLAIDSCKPASLFKDKKIKDYLEIRKKSLRFTFK